MRYEHLARRWSAKPFHEIEPEQRPKRSLLLKVLAVQQVHVSGGQRHRVRKAVATKQDPPLLHASRRLRSTSAQRPRLSDPARGPRNAVIFLRTQSRC